VSERLLVFAYGSLLFRPGFAFEERRRDAAPGWVRRFWQGSPDHRGTPEHPGRVVTLVREPGAQCEGAVYAVAPTLARDVLAYLDHREQGGYERALVELSSGERALTYVASSCNPHWLGPAPLPELARHVRASHGPSGSNEAYVRELARYLEAEGIVDAHVREVLAALDSLGA
jgi:cation transport protein ChaC